MKLYNKSQRNFQLANDVIVRPGEFFEVEKAAGEKLLELYSGEIVDSGAIIADTKAGDKLAKVETELADARKEIETLTTEKAKVETELADARKEIETLTTEKAKVEAELADARKEIETLTTEKAKVEAELEKLKKKLS